MPDPRRMYFPDRGDSTPFVQGPPVVKGVAEGMPPCPHCKCATLYDIEVVITGHPLLASGGNGVGRYIGCPACPFATPMLMVAR